MELLDTRSLLVSLVAAGLAIVLVLVQKQSLRNADRSRIAVKAARGTSTILLVGPMGSGKTSFFGRLVYRYTPATHTSMTLSTALLPDRRIQLTDLPGHPRLRSHLLAQQLGRADGVVFCIDPSSNASASAIQTTAEHLHVLLALLRTLEEKSGRPAAPVLILLTKSDSWSAAQKGRALERVRTSLEREFEKRRKASAGVAAASQARLESIDELPSDSSDSLGKNPFRAIYNFFTGSSGSQLAPKAAPAGGISLPEDEQEILQSDVLDYEGPFSWEMDKLGIPVSWATSSSKYTPPSAGEKSDELAEKAALEQDEGTQGFWDWVDQRVL